MVLNLDHPETLTEALQWCFDEIARFKKERGWD